MLISFNFILQKDESNMNINDIKNYIKNFQNIEENQRSKLLIVLVANVDGETQNYDDYQNTSVLSEYYTLDEYENLSVSLKKLGYEVISYFNETDFIDAIINNKINRLRKKILVINSAQTGTYIGRKSLIPAFCEHFKIMYTGSNPYVVSLCRDKFHSNAILNNYLQNPMPTYLYSYAHGWIDNKSPQEGEKIIVKLNGESASIGLTKENVFIYYSDADIWLKNLSKKYNQPIIAQPFISGYEVELPIIVGKESIPLFTVGIKINNSEKIADNFLDYSIRFSHLYDFYNYDNYNIDIADKMKKDSQKAVKILGIEGFGRVDYRIDCSGRYYISDIATNPHITNDSSYYFVFHKLGYSYSEFLSTLIGVTLSKYIS